MIISHKHSFIFFAIPKTGTHAIRFALRPHLGADDEEQVKLFIQSALPYEEIARLGHGHITWREIKAAIAPDVWESYFKFAFVRNPWDRFVSYCAFMHRKGTLFRDDPKTAMRNILANPEHRQRVVFRAQHEFICEDDGALAIDHAGRYEDLQASYDAVCDRLALPHTELERVNASTHNHYRDYYDDELKTQVGALYARDVAAFGYSF